MSENNPERTTETEEKDLEINEPDEATIIEEHPENDSRLIVEALEEENKNQLEDAVTSMSFIVDQARPVIKNPSDFSKSEHLSIAEIYEDSIQSFAVTFKLDADTLRKEVEKRYDIDSDEVVGLKHNQNPRQPEEQPEEDTDTET